MKPRIFPRSVFEQPHAYPGRIIYCRKDVGFCQSLSFYEVWAEDEETLTIYFGSTTFMKTWKVKEKATTEEPYLFDYFMTEKEIRAYKLRELQMNLDAEKFGI